MLHVLKCIILQTSFNPLGLKTCSRSNALGKYMSREGKWKKALYLFLDLQQNVL